jgi:hypothetical protein
VLSTIATAHTRHELAGAVAGQRAPTDGFAVAFGIGAALFVAGALVAAPAAVAAAARA